VLTDSIPPPNRRFKCAKTGPYTHEVTFVRIARLSVVKIFLSRTAMHDGNVPFPARGQI
jgi:hypothetical protein